MSRTVEEIVAELAPAYKEWKGGEKSKNSLKTEFFDAITEKLKKDGGLAEDLVTVHAESLDAAKEYVEQKYPGWLIEDWRDHPTDPGVYEVIISEDPAYQPFTIEFDGQVWGRQISEGATMLDDEALAAKDPELWKRVSEYPHQSLLEDIAYEAGMDSKDHEFEMDGYTGFDGYIEWQCERHGLKRALKSMDDISDDDLALLQAFTYVGKPQVKLPAPKKVKE